MSTMMQRKETKEEISKKKKSKQREVIHPGDLRENKGSIYLKDEYIPLFR